MAMRYRYSAFLPTLLSSLALAAATFAAPTLAEKSNSPEFREASHALQVNQLGEAYRLFSELWLKAPAYDVAILLGQTEFLLEKYRDAAEHLAIGLEYMPSADKTKVRRVKEYLGKAKAKVVTLTVSVSEPDAEIHVDDKMQGKSPLNRELYVDAGTRRVKATHPMYGSAEVNVEVAAGAEVPLTLKLVKVTAPEPPAKPVAAPKARQRPAETAPAEPPKLDYHGGVETRAIILIGGSAVTLIAATTAAIFAVKAKNARDDSIGLLRGLETAYGANPCWNVNAAHSVCTTISERQSDRTHAAKTFNVMMPIAGVAAVTTGLLYFLWPTEGQPAARQARLTPVASQSFGGLELGGAF
jgi:hypothetical protein